MSERLTFKEMKDALNSVPTIDEGTMVHMNHIGCEAGVDSKRRLYIKNTGDFYLFKCHHCGKDGYLNNNKLTRPSLEFDNTLKSVHHKMQKDAFNTLPIANVHNMPPEQRLWIYSYGFTDKDLFEFGVRTDAEGLLLPVNSSVSSPAVVQTRVFNGRVKYKTHTFDKGVCRVYPETPSKYPKVVFTEDILSAYKVSMAGHVAIPLMTTSINDATLSYVASDAILRNMPLAVWLDPDVAGRTGSLKVARELSATGKSVEIVNADEPKHCSIEEIKVFLGA